jgi:hypothetical protein
MNIVEKEGELYICARSSDWRISPEYLHDEETLIVSSTAAERDAYIEKFRQLGFLKEGSPFDVHYLDDGYPHKKSFRSLRILDESLTIYPAHLDYSVDEVNQLLHFAQQHQMKSRMNGHA